MTIMLSAETRCASHTINSFVIVDAKDSGLSCDVVYRDVCSIAHKELKEDEGMMSAASYVRDEYFEGRSMTPALGVPQTILIATVAGKIIGFAITATKILGKLPADAGYLAYIAVDSESKKSGVGTALMLATMQKTKELGKRYLKLEYIAEGVDVDSQRGITKQKFYDSFEPRFGIPTEERDAIQVYRQLHIHLYYDLKDFDFAACQQVLNPTTKNLPSEEIEQLRTLFTTRYDQLGAACEASSPDAELDCQGLACYLMTGVIGKFEEVQTPNIRKVDAREQHRPYTCYAIWQPNAPWLQNTMGSWVGVHYFTHLENGRYISKNGSGSIRIFDSFQEMLEKDAFPSGFITEDCKVTKDIMQAVIGQSVIGSLKA